MLLNPNEMMQEAAHSCPHLPWRPGEGGRRGSLFLCSQVTPPWHWSWELASHFPSEESDALLSIYEVRSQRLGGINGTSHRGGAFSAWESESPGKTGLQIISKQRVQSDYHEINDHSFP